MCRLFGFRSNVESRAHRSLVVAENAMANQASYHSDGWGIGYFIDEDPYLFRTSKGAAQDDSFRRFSEGLRSNTLLVHIRKATVGAIDPINSHPFRYGSWIFAHNGTIFAFDKIKRANAGRDTTRVSACVVRHDRFRDDLLLFTFSDGAQGLFSRWKV